MFIDIFKKAGIRPALRYHELKQERGAAEFLYAGNFIKEGADLTQQDLLFHFERLEDKCDTIDQKILHICITFHEGVEIANDTMRAVTQQYLEKMNLGDQPYLLYRHNDTGIPHMHIVLSRIREDGSPIVMHYEEYHQSVRICRQLEKEYNLDPPHRTLYEDLPDNRMQKVMPGEPRLYVAVNHILKRVIDNYHFTNIDELNAVILPYNIRAQQVKSGEKHKRGLYYQILENGKPSRRYIFKASHLPGKPTLVKLTRRYAENLAHQSRQQHRQRITTAIDWALLRTPMDLTGLQQRLQNDRIKIEPCYDEQGRMEKIFYIDHQNKTVFEGKDLGPRYDADGIRDRTISIDAIQTQGIEAELKKTPREQKRQTINNELI